MRPATIFKKNEPHLFDRNLAPVAGGERDLRSIYLPAFQKGCVEAGALSIMTAYSNYDGVPAVADARRFFLQLLLTTYLTETRSP